VAAATDRIRRGIERRLPRYAWAVKGRIAPGGCPVCGSASRARRGYGRLFRECGSCGFIWSHDSREAKADEGMGIVGSWGGPEKGGERDDFLVRFLNEDRPRRRVLLYGTGTTLVFRVLHDEGFDVTGTDISHEVVAYRRQEFGDRFIHADELHGAGGGYDVITACEVFEHLHDPPRWIGTLAANLAPDGVLCGSTNFYPGSGPIEDDQKVGYMSLDGHVAYWSERSFAEAAGRFGLQTEVFELVCPGSVKPDPTFGSLFPNKRLFFATRDDDLIARLRELKRAAPILPCDTSDYPVAAYAGEATSVNVSSARSSRER
jgi:SAM-dependent methyltransferase